MAAPSTGFACGMFSRICTRNRGLSQQFQFLLCSKLSSDFQSTHRCIHKQVTRCRKRYIGSHIEPPVRHYSFRGYRGKLLFDTPKKSRDFVATLLPKERKMILSELQSFQDRVDREGKLQRIIVYQLEHYLNMRPCSGLH